MSNFSKFMKTNKVQKENEFYAPTKSLHDEDGTPLKWEFRHISSAENEKLRDSCTTEVQITGKPGMFRQKVDSSTYVKKMIIASTVVPDLYDKELQDSYGVMKPEDLLLELVDDPGEYNDLAAYVQKLNGFDVSFEEKVDQAKN